MDDQQQLLFLQLCSEFLKLGYLYTRLFSESNNRKRLMQSVNSRKKQQYKGLNYFRELMRTNHNEFFDWTRMSPHQFKNLYKLVRPRLLKRSHHSIHPELRLILTLSYLAHGNRMFLKKGKFKIGKSTVYQIVSEVCRIIWDVLQPYYLAQPTQNVWSRIADGFSQKWQFPNCIGSVGGKRIRIQCPPNSGNQYSNSQKCFSLVLMAICDTDYKFTMINIGQFDSISDGEIWAHCDLSHLFDNNLLDVPPKKELPDKLIGTEYTLVGNEAFPLKKHLLCPYLQFQLTDNERIFNYRLSRAQRVVENTFGILISRWRILARSLRFSPENAEHLVKALICLHNFIITEEKKIAPARRWYCSPQLIDRETADGILLEGAWRKQSDKTQNIDQLSSNDSDDTARIQRNVLQEYFITEIGEAQVPWQYQQAFRECNTNSSNFQ